MKRKHLRELPPGRHDALMREFDAAIATAAERIISRYRGGGICEGCIMRVLAGALSRIMATAASHAITNDADAAQFLRLVEASLADARTIAAKMGTADSSTVH